MIKTSAYAAPAASAPLVPHAIRRREPGPNDVLIDIRYCGICHTDLHFWKDDLGFSSFPLVPGHEIAGVVRSVGAKVTDLKPGDPVGVGCMVDSCRRCPDCAEGLEQYCPGMIQTYGGHDADGPTQGGYSAAITVDRAFVLTLGNLPLDKAGPLLCAGVTTWSPLKHWGVKAGSKVAVVGLGGLGHMAVKLAAAMGAEVTVISTSARKKDDALAFGAAGILLSTDPIAIGKSQGRFELIINTVSSAGQDMAALTGLLARDGTMVMLGIDPNPLAVPALPLIMGRKAIAGSVIGGIRETQEMLDFCDAHGILPETELIPVSRVNEAFARLEKGDVRYRFVLDMAAL